MLWIITCDESRAGDFRTAVDGTQDGLLGVVRAVAVTAMGKIVLAVELGAARVTDGDSIGYDSCNVSSS